MLDLIKMLIYYYYMDIRKKIVLKAILLIMAAFLMQTGLFAQASSPFVSGLNFEVRNNMLRLDWVDSPDMRGPVHIYRSLSPFNEPEALLRLRPIVIPYGREFYIDEIDFSGTYYYFIAASDETGSRHISFNQGNTLEINIDSPGLAHETPGITALGIYYLSTRIVSSRVIINFSSTEFANNVLFRGTSPIRNAQDLANAMIVRENAVSPVIDLPVPGIPYYYALVPEAGLSQGNIRILPGINSTIEPVIIMNEAARTANLREIPLPLLTRSHAAPGIPSFGTAQINTELNPATQRVLDFIPNIERQELPSIISCIFTQDLKPANTEDDYHLGIIIQDLFARQNWEASKNALLRFISEPRSQSTEARAMFYLGQCFYFMNEASSALVHFLKAETIYPDESAEWIQASLMSIIAANN